MLAKLFGPAALLVLTALMVFAARIDAPPSAVADVNHRNADGSTPLQWAVYKGDVAEVRRLLDDGASLQAKDRLGAMPLSHAAREGRTGLVGLYLDKGAAIDERNLFGATALYFAADTERPRIVALLLEKGADPDLAGDVQEARPWLGAGVQLGQGGQVRLVVDGERALVQRHADVG